MHSILIVDDEPNYLIVLSELLKDEGFEVFTAPGGRQGLALVKEVDLDAVITDMQMPGMDGLQFLQSVKEHRRDLPVIIITAYAEVEKAVAAMQSGAFSYLAKPFANDELVVTINRAAEHYGLIKENNRLRSQLHEQDGCGGIIGKNPKMLKAYELIAKAAPTPALVLISGETGTGKELAAKAIHRLSPRKEQPFIKVNCAALPDHLLERELFGHEKGAFTEAASMRKGRFELADGGTIFLDEVGELSLTLQAKVLGFIQEKRFERVGGTRTLTADVRVISASHRDLKEEVQQGRFREELFYRLNVINVVLPPLRERMDDLGLLAAHFIGKFAKALGRDDIQLSPSAMKLLMKLPWEGNIRELENTMERAVVLCNGNTIEPDDVQPDAIDGEEEPDWGQEMDLSRFIPDSAELNDVLHTIEKKMLLKALEDSGYVQARAAEKLGITKSLLQYKMKKYKIGKKK
ncbi:MAG: DNA-binding response regulator [Deltaproteobacteria bacterium]|nr:MAG: DNA-binding response regulator [Deltaproteobacteria bacterium]